ncbi:MAG: hypothetical protein LBT38_03740 [Deltaproteobacteria bacterium]|nr:hypothetical protein [Deltaproteobacteria bacterium]
MKSLRVILLVSLLSALFWPSLASAITADPSDYYAAPPLMIGGTKPAILMVLSKDAKMFAPAYAAPADHDGDGRMDVGFNPAVEYTGVFDPYSCYAYLKGELDYVDEKGNPHKKGADITKRGHFIRVGASVEDTPDASGTYPDASRLAEEIRDGYADSANGRPGYRAPKAKTGICPQRRNPGSGEKMDGENLIWSGNWLNWITSSRIDVIRQILYGGKRVIDTPTSTYLTAEWIPENAGVWAFDEFTKFFWLDYHEAAPYYDSLKFSPIDPKRWSGEYRRLNIYGRSDNKLIIYDNIWFLRQREEVLNREGFRSFVAYYPARDRFQYLPPIFFMNSFNETYKNATLEVVVEACKPLTKKEAWDLYYGHILGRTDAKQYKGRVPASQADIPEEALIEKGDYCQRYGGNYKPSGLLQKYALLDQALFGLLTGAFSDLNRWDAGWLRQNVTSIRNHINSDGTFNGDSLNNIFRMLDAISPVTKAPLEPWKEKPRKGNPVIDTEAKQQGKGWRDPLESNFGNPIGEMLYQGLLYFAKTSKSSYSHWPTSNENQEATLLPRLGASGFDTWRSPLSVDSGDCLKPVILLLSDVTTSHDGDSLPGTPHGTVGDTAPTLNLNFPNEDHFHDAKGLGKSFNVSHYLSIITEQENLAGQTYYVANTNTGAPGATVEGGLSRQHASSQDTNLCVPRVINNLADVRGLCPSAPQTYGTYSVAAAAYYGNTHAFDGGLNTVQTYVVALPTIFPEIKLESKNRSISFSPVALSVKYPCGNNGEGDQTYCKNGQTEPSGITFLGPFATNIIQWRADDAGRVYSGAVFAGFSSRLEGEGNDYQLDAPTRYYFDLIRECLPSEKCGQTLTESRRYTGTDVGGGYPKDSTEQKSTAVFLRQAKYVDKYGYVVKDTLKKWRDEINGWGSTAERNVANLILADYKDGRYAGAPYKKRREFVYKNWDNASRPNYLYSGERPKFYKKAAYPPNMWSQTPAMMTIGTGILASDVDPDPALIESYAKSFYGELSGTNREKAMWLLPGGQGYKKTNTDASVDLAPYDESASLFIDRPFQDIGYGEVMDVYGYIGEPRKIYKKVTKPEEIDDAIGVVLFTYSLYEEIDGSDRDRPMNIGYYTHGGLNYAQSKEENPSRTLGVANGTYLEVQNEHNYMGGSSYELKDHYTTAGKDFGLMTIAHELNTPPTCFRAGQISTSPVNFRAADRDGRFFKNNVPANLEMPGFANDFDKTPHSPAIPSCGSARLPLTSTRFFRFPTEGESVHPTFLPNPLWLAAKYGGFNDINNDGVPQKAEWDVSPAPNGDGIPDNYFYANNLSELKDRLIEAFEKIMTSITVGASSSASINAIMGGGITIRTYYQTIHTPYSSEPGDNEVKWIGGAYSLFVDPYGNLREDTNGNGLLDLTVGFGAGASTRGPASQGDWIVEFVNCKDIYVSSEAKKCQDVRDKSDLKSIVRIFADQDGKNNVDYENSAYVSLEDLRTVWNLAQNLAAYSDNEIVNNRKVYFYDEEISGSTPRVLGSQDRFSPTKKTALAKKLMTTTDAAAESLIKYVLGVDQAGMRSRKTLAPWYVDKGKPITCRLGDIINSQPVIVGAPFSAFDEMYRDPSYGLYRSAKQDRKNIAIIGANDGLLRALDLGKHVSYTSGKNGYIDSTGQELWAFIPQSILPHLQWLAREDYAHSYFLDLTPFVAEVKDTTKSGVDAWRTVLLVSLRFGGRAIEVTPATKSSKAKYSYSEVFALDVTDTTAPTLLWRFSHPQMGLVVARPVVSRSHNEWKVLVGSGPTYDLYVDDQTTEPGPEGRLAYRGYSNQSARLFVFDALKGPGVNNTDVQIIDSKEPKSFVAQSFLAIAPNSTLQYSAEGAVSWKNTLAYFSLNQAAPDDRLLCLKNSSDLDPFLKYSNSNDRCSSSKYGHYGYFDKGGVWRLNMSGSPSNWDNEFKLFFNSERPISAAVNATTDPQGNVWVIFGSGRYWHDEDSRLCEGAGNNKECRLNHVNYLYGVKEPRNADGTLAYQAVTDNQLTDVSNIYVFPDRSLKTVTAVDNQGNASYVPNFATSGGDIFSDYDSLSNYLASSKTRGYKKALQTALTMAINSDEIDDPNNQDYKDTDWWKGMSSEMLIQQAAIAIFWGQSHMAFSTFLPENVSCGSAGKSFHVLLDSFTGLPSPVMGSELFKTYNRTQDVGGFGAEKPISDHYSYSEGMNVPTTVVTTYINGRSKTAFVTTTSSGVGGSGNKRHSEKDSIDGDAEILGGGLSFVEPVGEASKGVVSWREVLDSSIFSGE